MRKGPVVLFAFLLVIPLAFAYSAIGTHDSRHIDISKDMEPYQAQTGFLPHDPIVIDGNEDFQSKVILEGWSGSGIPSHPYLIENYEIVCNNSAGIDIRQVMYYFTIRNCRIIGISDLANPECDGFALDFCDHVTIDSCYIANMWNGIDSKYSNGTITNTVIEQTASHSIKLSRCDDMDVVNCTLEDKGIIFEDSDSISVNGNTIRNVAGSGIELAESWDIECLDNTLSNITEFGIFGGYLYHGDFSGNQFTNCELAGIYFFGGDYCSITSNTFLGCGIHISSSISTILEYHITGNSVNGKPIAYFRGLTSTLIDAEPYGQVILVGCQNVGVINGRLNDASTGVCFSNCYHCTVTDTQMRWNGFFGFRAEYSDHSTVIDVLSSENRIGISLWISAHSKVENCRIEFNEIAAVYSSFSDFGIFINNTVSGTDEIPSQMALQDSNLLTITDNIFHNAGLALDFTGLQEISHIIEGNTVNGKPLFYASELSDENIECSNLGQVLLAMCENVTLLGGEFQGVPLELLNCRNCSVVDASIFGSFGIGVLSYYSNGTILENVQVLNATGSGIYIHASYNSSILSCATIGCLGDGIVMRYGHDSIITGNTASRNGGVGFEVDSTRECVFAGNTANENGESGIRLSGSTSWMIIYNTFLDNGRYGIEVTAPYEREPSRHTIFSNSIGWNIEGNAIDDGLLNSWDDSVARGNQWSDWWYNSTTQWYWIPGDAGSHDRYPSLLTRNVTFPIIPVALILLGGAVAAIGIGFFWKKKQIMQTASESTSQ